MFLNITTINKKNVLIAINEKKNYKIKYNNNSIVLLSIDKVAC